MLVNEMVYALYAQDGNTKYRGDPGSSGEVAWALRMGPLFMGSCNEILFS